MIPRFMPNLHLHNEMDDAAHRSLVIINIYTIQPSTMGTVLS